MRKKKQGAVKIISLFILIILLLSCIVISRFKDNISVVPSVIFSSVDDNKTSETEWYLILVNSKNHIPQNSDFDLIQLNNGNSVDSRIYPDLQAMFDDMRSAGIYPIVSEGFRTSEQQEQMMTDKINAYINEGYSKSESKKLAAQLVAKVGYSEHQLGLALDINAEETYSSNEEVYNWLAENAYKYGFILRYPADKTDITGIDFEPWHYRYVGKDDAYQIYSQGVCLEEYLDERK